MPNDFDIFEGFEEGTEKQEQIRTTETKLDVFDGFEEVDSATNSAKRNLKLVQDRDPKAEAKVRKDVEETGQTTEFLRTNPDYNTFERDKAIEDAPAGTTNLIASDMLNAGIFQQTKTIKDLSTIERLMTEEVGVGAALKAPVIGIAAGIIKTPEAVLDAYDVAREALEGEPFDLSTTFEKGRIITEINEAIEKHKDETMLDLRRLSQEGQDFLRSKIGDTKFEELLFQAGETIGRMTGAALVGGGESILAILSLSSGLAKTREALEEGSPRHRAAIAGVLSAFTEYWTEKIPLEILRRPGLNFFQRLIKGEVADVPGELVATATEMWAIDEKTLGKQAQPLEVYIQALIDTALVATFTTVGTTTGVTALEKASKSVDNDARRSTNNIETLKLISEKLAESNIQEELGVENSQIAMQSIVGEEDGYIDPEGAISLFQIDDPNRIQAVSEAFTALGIQPKEAMRQAQNGQDIIIKQADMLGLLNKEQRDLLLPHFKVDVSDLSETQITENVAEDNKIILDESIAAVEQEEAAFTSELDRIKDQIQKATGSTEQTEANAALIENFANNIALQGADRAAFLASMTFKRIPFAKRTITAAKRFLGQTEARATAEALSQEIATLAIRIDKIDPTSEENQEAITKLESRKAQAEQELRDTALDGFVTLFQADNQRKITRAQLIAGEGKLLFELFEKVDPSSIPHELGHAFLLEMTSVEEIQDISEQFKSDMQSIRAWLGVEQGADYTVEQQEQFARGFERWLREGNAPNEELKTVFARFKRWLTEKYRRLLPESKSKLTPEIRGVFNRMLDADNETKTAAAVHNMIEPTAERMNELGVPDDQQSDIKRLVRKGIEKANNALFRARQRAVRENKDKFEREAEQEVRAEDSFGRDFGVYDIIEDIRTKVAAAREQKIPKVIKATKTKGVVRISESNKETLRDIRTLFVKGAAVQELFPTAFRDRGFTSEKSINVLTKAIEGKPLTVLQKKELELLTETYREHIVEQISITEEAITDEPRLNRQEFIDLWGEDTIKELPAKGLLVNNGKSLDEAALDYGFESSSVMVVALLGTQPLDIAIQNRVNRKNEELENTFKSEDFLAETKEYSDFIEIWTDHLRNEQARATRAEVTGVPRKKITTEQIKSYAQEQINEMSVKSALRTDRFLNAMKRAAVAMRKAEKAKDFAKAIRESEKMLLNKEMAAISVRNKRAVTSFVNRAKKFRKLGAPQSVSLRFREGIRSLVNRFSILPNVAPQKEDYSIEDLRKLLTGDEHIGEFFASEFIVPERPEDVRVRDYRDISVLELTELDNLMKFLTKMGRDEQTGILSDGETQLKTVVGENVEEMGEISPQKVHDRFSIARKTTDISRKFFANLLGLPYITKALGGYQALKGKISSLEKWITERLKDVEDDRLRRTDLNNQAIQEAVTVIGNAQRRMIKDAKGRKLFDSGVPVPEIIQDNGSQLNYWTPEQIMTLAFNRGNQSNINAVLQGFEGLTLGQVDTLLNKYLTTQDMNAVQTILDQMESFFSETDRVHVKMKGFHIGKVPAQAWTFKGKTYRGGYYPLNYDRALSDFIGEKKEIEDLFESEKAKFTVPFAAANHTITRTESGHALPVDLRLIHIYRHFDKTIRYITHAEAVRDIDRIIRDKEWRKAAEKALGKDIYQQIRPSLKHIANPHIPGVDIPGKRAVGYLRSVATAANLALNTMVAMKQVFSTPSAIHDMGLGDGGGFKAYIRGMGHVLASPAVSFNTMLEMSPYMKERITSWERDLLRPKFNRMTPAQREVAFGNRHVTWDDVVNLGFFEIKAMDTATVLPIWWGAYLDKLNEFSSNEAEAIRHADNIVRDTQPSATALDLSAWFREGGFFGLFNLHQTFTVGKYGQRQRTYFRAWNYGKGSISTLDYAWFNFMDAFIPLVSINVMVAFLKGGDLTGDPDEWWDIAEKAASSWLFMGIPLVSSFYDAITKGWRDPLEVPGARQVKRTARTIGHLGQGTSNIITGESLSDKEKQQLYWGMADLVSDFSRVPMSKVSKKALEGEGFREKIFGKQFKK